MSRSLGVLRLDLVALTGKFDQNFKSAVGVLDKFGATATKISTAATGAFKKVGSTFSGISKSILSVQNILTGAIAVIGGAKVIGAFDDAAESIDNIGKKARTVGLSMEAISVLKLAAEESGVEFETLAKMVGKASKNIATFASTGGGPGADAIRRLRLNIFDLNGGLRPMEAMLPEIATQIEKISDQGEKLRLAEGLFGREGGAQFVQWIEDSGGFMKNLGEQTERARKLGILFTETQFQKLKAYRDAVGRISSAWLGLRVAVMTEVAPALTKVVDDLALRMATVGKFLGNLASVVRAAVGREDISGEGTNNAVEAMKKVARAMVDALWSEVSTRLRLFFAHVWEFVKVSLSELFGEAGRFVTGLFGEIGGVIGSVLNEVGKAIGRSLLFISDKLTEAGSFLGDAWEKAGENLGDYAKELEDTRAVSWLLFTDSVDGINELGEKYRALRGDVEKTGDAISSKMGKPVSEMRRQWNEFFSGMKEEFQNLADEANDFATLGKNVFGAFSRTIGTELSASIAKGETSIKNFGETLSKVLTNAVENVSQLILQFLIYRAIVGGLNPLLGTSEVSGPGLPDVAGPGVSAYAAKGGVFGFASGGVASGVLNGPTGFGFSKKVGVAGEKGRRSEVAFAPLRNIGGELGVRSATSPVEVQIFDQRSSGARPEVESTETDGRKTVKIFIRDEVNRQIGEGRFDRRLGSRFGVTPKGVRR